jgi:membrane-associated phospholipid phosphatase
MPPLFAHDPLAAAQRAIHPGWLLALATALSVACEYWALTLVALAVFAWLEHDVPSALKGFVPFVLALTVAIGFIAVVGRVGAAAGLGVRAVPSAHALWGATFAAYLFRVYGKRRGLVAALLPLAGGLSRIFLGSNGIPSVAVGWVIGALLGLATFELAARAAPQSPAGLRRGQQRDPGRVPGA